MIFLVDMDGPLADFERGILGAFRNAHPDRPYVPLEERTTFKVADQYLAGDRVRLEEIYTSEGFYRNLPLVDGARQGLERLARRHDVYICTSPLSAYEHCVAEKYAWVDEHFGAEWVRRLVLSKDKTLVRGDVLIDDRPSVSGRLDPTWEHWLYDMPFNRSVEDKRRFSWRG